MGVIILSDTPCQTIIVKDLYTEQTYITDGQYFIPIEIKDELTPDLKKLLLAQAWSVIQRKYDSSHTKEREFGE